MQAYHLYSDKGYLQRQEFVKHISVDASCGRTSTSIQVQGLALIAIPFCLF